MRKSNNTLWNFDGIHNREKLACSEDQLPKYQKIRYILPLNITLRS